MAVDTFLDKRVEAVATNVTAIKAKTDNLPTDPGDESNLLARMGTPAGASLSADTAAVKAETALIKTEADKIGAVGDAVAAAGAAGSVHAHIRSLQTNVGAGDDASTADGVVGSVFSKFRLLYTAVLTTLAAFVKRERIQFGNSAVTKTNATSYLNSPYVGSAASATAVAGVCVPIAGSLSKLYVRKTDDADQDAVFTIMINGVDSALTCTLAGAGSVYAGSDLVNTVAVAAGDVIALKVGLGVAPSADLANVFAAVIFDRT